MRKSTLLKIATTLTAMFLISGVFAQTNTGAAGATGWVANTTVGDYVSTAGNKVTFGKAMPFWVWPSAAYNPDWDYSTIVPYATAAVITTDVTSSFAWSATGTPTITVTQTGAPLTNRNYATISWPVADLGDRTITVTETPASGICAATPVTFTVTVIDIPKFSITTVASKFGLTNLIQSNCWALANDNLSTIPFTIDAASGEEYPFAFYLDYKIYTVDGLDASGNVPVTGGNLNTGVGLGVTPVAYDSRVNGVVAGVPTKTGNPISVAAGTDLIASTD